MQRRRVHYVLSTHWDREWHQSFQHFRYRLVQLLDRVIAGLEDGRLVGPFTCDGQAIILEDYLEIRPERQEQVERLVREGKLVVGPWYVLPDEWLVSGEAMVRNLRRGREIARKLGHEPSNAGFACDLFGHHSQVPQILAGFGCGFGIIWRGLNTIEHRNLLWRGADGTELPCFRFGLHGYCGYDNDVRHTNDPSFRQEAERFNRDLDAWLAREAEHTAVDAILMFDGGDHLEWDPDNYALLRARIEEGGGEFEIVHTTLDAYGAELAAQADRITEVVEGELREPASLPGHIDVQWLIPGVLSSRVWIKQANVECQDLLCLWAEPMSAFAHAALGCEVPDGFLDVAWGWLLQNHPHDSICGCSIDQVHEDMKYRFSQCRQIAEQVTVEATHKLAASIGGTVADDELRVTLFNPLPEPFDGPTELVLQIPTEWPCFNEFFGFEAKPAFRIYNADGHELAYQRVAQAMGRIKKIAAPANFPQAYRTHDVTVALEVQVPACGYTTLTVKPEQPGLPTRYPEVPGLATSERSMANEYLTVSVQSNGTLTVVDRHTGEVYDRLLTFESCADIGDGWYHGQAVNDQVFTSSSSAAEVALVANGPYLTTFRVRTTMRVPAELRFDGMVRSDQMVELILDSRVSLRPGRDWVEVETKLRNTAADHRLRVLFPSGASSEVCLADTPFDVVERPIALRADNHLYRELEVETKPQQSWTAVHHGDRGLAIVSTGLMESTVRDLPDRPVALTLLRSTRRTVMTDGEPEGLLLGHDLAFRYCIVPLAAEPDRAALCYLGQHLGAGLRAVQLRPGTQRLHRVGSELPATGSLLRVEGPVVVTSVRQVAGALEARLFNPNVEGVAAELHADGRTSAQPVDLESKPVGEALPMRDGLLNLDVGAKKIVTLRMT